MGGSRSKPAVLVRPMRELPRAPLRLNTLSEGLHLIFSSAIILLSVVRRAGAAHPVRTKYFAIT